MAPARVDQIHRTAETGHVAAFPRAAKATSSSSYVVLGATRVRGCRDRMRVYGGYTHATWVALKLGAIAGALHSHVWAYSPLGDPTMERVHTA
jgi:hypothetical protein